MLDWSDLRFFLAVAREGRLLAAGRTLGVRHTTVARRIDALEHALEAKLFHRTTRGWRLTPLGQRLVASATAMEEEAHRVVARARQEATSLRGRVRIALPESWAYGWLAPHLPELHARHPGIQVEVLTGNAQLDLTRGEADLALRTPRPKQRELSAVLLCEGGFGLFAARELAKQIRKKPDGRGVPLGLYTPDFHFLQNAPWFQTFSAQADVRLTTPSTMTLLAAARAGHCAVPIPRFLGRGDDVLVEVGASHASWHKVWLVTHPEVRRDPRVAAVASFMREIAKPLDET